MTQAAATAYVLLGLIVPKLVGAERNNMPAVLQKARALRHSGEGRAKLLMLNHFLNRSWMVLSEWVGHVWIEPMWGYLENVGLSGTIPIESSQQTQR